MSVIEQLAHHLSLRGRHVELHGTDRLLVGNPWDNICVVAWRDAPKLNVHQGFNAHLGISSVEEAAELVLSL